MVLLKFCYILNLEVRVYHIRGWLGRFKPELAQTIETGKEDYNDAAWASPPLQEAKFSNIDTRAVWVAGGFFFLDFFSRWYSTVLIADQGTFSKVCERLMIGFIKVGKPAYAEKRRLVLHC